MNNDSDIIEYLLEDHSVWADKIFIYDNGSTDNTWELINEIAKINPKVIPWKKEKRPFNPGLRAELYNEYRNHAREGDWWCFMMDTDEFYVDDPREFLSKVPKFYQVVWGDAFLYCLTWEDVDEFSFTNSSPHDSNQLKYYQPYTFTEPRFFRHRDRLKWSNDMPKPDRIGVAYPQKIRFKHYQFRSPLQIQQRLDLRRKSTEEGYKRWSHTNQLDWKEKVVYRKDMIKETQDFPTLGCRNPHIPGRKYTRLYHYYLPMLLHFMKVYP